MDVTSAAKIIKSSDVMTIVLLLAIAAVPVIKGFFAVLSGRHQRRKEFLEFWKEVELRDDNLWLEEIFQHRYGAALPAPLIRHVLSLQRPAVKLRKLAMVSDFFSLDETRSIVAWTRPRRGRLRWFLLEVLTGGLAYFVFASIGVALGLQGVKALWSFDGVALTFLGLVLVVMAGGWLLHSMALTEARSTLALVNDRPNPNLLRDLRRALGAAVFAVLGGFRSLANKRAE